MRITNCHVEGCSGQYEEHVLKYCNLDKVHTDLYYISPEAYEKLPKEEQRSYNRVVSSYCNKCQDSYEERLLAHIRNIPFEHHRFTCGTPEKE